MCSRLLVIGERKQSHSQIGRQRRQLCEEAKWCSVAIPKSRSLSGEEVGAGPPSIMDLGRPGSISRLRKPLDRAADEDGVSAHSRDDPSRGRRDTLSPSETSVALAGLASSRRHRLSVLDRRAPERR
jgi:hypothetical protein